MLLPYGLGAAAPKHYEIGKRKDAAGKKIPLTLAYNNPGGVKVGDAWKGLVKSRDGKHCTFESPVYGFRALAIILKNYQKKHGITTLYEIFNRWAPSDSGEGNDPVDYARRVSKRTGLDVERRDDKLGQAINNLTNSFHNLNRFKP